MLDKLKHWPTTLLGLFALMAALPHNPMVQELIKLNPTLAKYVTGIASVGAGIVLIFGVGAANTGVKK